MEEAYSKNGLIGILVNKKIIDFPALIRACRVELKLFGYSNEALFQDFESVKALGEVIQKKEIDVKILICDPHSEVAKLRDNEPLYRERDLISEIRNTVQGYQNFIKEISPKDRGKIKLGLFDKIAYTSIVIFDQHCITSQYSNHLSGSAGDCFVYKNNPTCSSNTYRVIHQEFMTRWKESTIFTENDYK